MIIRSVREVLRGRKLHRIGPQETARAGGAALAEAEVGALAVMEGDTLVGILTECDVIRRCVADGRRTDETRVADIMTPDPVTVSADAKLADAMDAMVRGGIRHLPVTDGGAVVGMLSMRDIPTDYRLMAERFAEYRRGPSGTATI